MGFGTYIEYNDLTLALSGEQKFGALLSNSFCLQYLELTLPLLVSTELRDTAALILAVLARAGVLAPACTVDMDRRERAEPGRSAESSTEPGRDITRLASDMARGSSTWFCSTTCRSGQLI